MFSCMRCGYSTNVKCNLKNHLMKKKICPPVVSGIDRSYILDNIAKDIFVKDEEPNKTKHMCIYCNSTYSKNSNLHRHQKTCPLKKKFEEEQQKANEKKKAKQIKFLSLLKKKKKNQPIKRFLKD